MNKIMQTIFAFSVISSFSHLANAGVSSSGGGDAVVCLDSSGDISSAELLDLYEARNLHGMNIQNSDAADIDQALEASHLIAAGEAIDGTVGPIIESSIQRIYSSMRILPSGVGLTPIGDFHAIILPKNCKVMQLARYDLNEMISVDGDIWKKLNNTNKAALLVHEALYRYLRSFGESTSDHTRMAVGKAFGGIKFQSVRDGIPSDAIECGDNSLDGQNRWWFAAFKSAEDSVTLQFFMINGSIMLSKATASLGGDTWPFPYTKSNTFAYLSVNSILDGGLPIMLGIRLDDTGVTKSYIDVSQSFVFPKTEFICR